MPIALSGMGFGPYITVLATGEFLMAAIVALVPFFDSGSRSLEEINAGM